MGDSLNPTLRGPQGNAGSGSIITNVDPQALNLTSGELSGNVPPADVGSRALLVCIPGPDGSTPIGSVRIVVNQFGQIVSASNWNG